MSTTIRSISGHWSRDGYLDGRGTVRCIVDGQSIIDADLRAGPDAVLRCEQWGNDAPIITNGCWEFMPDAADLTRLGIVPVQMIREG